MMFSPIYSMTYSEMSNNNPHFPAVSILFSTLNLTELIVDIHIDNQGL